MIAFLLGLLKTIGIILLVILILLIILVGSVLFVPIYYWGEGQITDEKKGASVKITWLLKAIQCKVDYIFPEGPIIIVKVFGIDIKSLLEKKKETDIQTSQSENVSKKQASGVNTSLLEPTPAKQDDKSSVITFEKNTENPKSETPNPKIKKTDYQKDAEKIPLKEKIQAMIDKIKEIIYNIKYYLAILQEEDTQELIKKSWGAILEIFKNIRPKEFRLTSELGFATPDTTGKIYGMYATVMPLVGEYIIIEPNFEQQIIRGELKLKGRITVFVLVKNALKILFDKRLQPLIKKLKRGGKKNGRK